MVDIVFENMCDAIDEMVLSRLGRDGSITIDGLPRHIEAEQRLIRWFSEKGINLQIKGWDKYTPEEEYK